MLQSAPRWAPRREGGVRKGAGTQVVPRDAQPPAPGPRRFSVCLQRWILGALALALGCFNLDNRVPSVAPPPESSEADVGSDDVGSDNAPPPSDGETAASRAAAVSNETEQGLTPTNLADEVGESGRQEDAPGAEPAATELALVLSASLLDFGVVGLGQTSIQRVEIRNRGNDGVVVSVEAQTHNGNTPAFEAGGECQGQLSPNATCELPVHFSPSSLGQWEGSLLVVSDRGEMGSVALVGVARAAPYLVSGESTFTFEPLEIGRAASHRWALTNDGGVETNPIAVRFLGWSADGIDFSVLHDCERLAPGATCNVDVTFAPSSAGSQSGTVNASAASGIAGVGPLELKLSVSGSGL